ncbi:MAG: hypothetical protein QOJ04_6642 [Caballeronia sp.]|jgi:hypothetical protein|nr:hypothetical protein [Caballeronia sp.]
MTERRERRLPFPSALTETVVKTRVVPTGNVLA